MKKIVFYVYSLILYFISYLVPKDDKMWLFGSWDGQRYADQSKYLFKYIVKNHTDIRAIWLTRNQMVYEQLKGEGYEVYLLYSIPAIWYSMRAKVLYVTQKILADLHYFNNNKAIFRVQLWHGSSFKKTLHDSHFANVDLKKQKKKKLLNFIFPFYNEQYDLLISTSEEDKAHLSTAFRIPKEKIKIVGHPRNDILFLKKEDDDDKKILYAPTLRRDNNNTVLDVFNNDDINIIDNMMNKIGAKLYVKLHPANTPKSHLLESLTKAENIVLMDQGADIQEAMITCDILITDYSSSWIDFLLTDRPIIFAPFDYDNYLIEDRTFYYDYDKTTPGPKVKNWIEATEWIEKFLNDPSLYFKERKIIRNRFHTFQDANSCERVYKTVLKELKIDLE
ncbi:MAG: hypothetical protein COB07_11675 [Sulfurovum sp.]|nr:MAG: hypothetical protein COB07_11675 [Sulfurovum sp.]